MEGIVIFDSDPGLDDAFALIWLLEGFKNNLYLIEGLTSVEGNIGSFESFRNIMHMVNLTSPTSSKHTKLIRKRLKSIPISKMHDNENNNKSSDDDEFVPLDDFMGSDGLLGLSQTFKDFPNVFATPKKVKKWYNDDKRTLYSEDLIIKKLKQYPNEISILCVGPVTNLYLAEKKEPGILALARDIYIMGGVFGAEGGNIDELTEFNFKNDANALYKLFSIIDEMKGIRVPNIFIFPLDITRKLKWNVEQFELLYSLLNTLKQSEIEMCRMKIDGVDDEVQQMYDVQEEDVYCTQTGLMYHFLEKATEKMIIQHYEWGIGDYMELHDLSIIGFILYPHLFDFKYVKCNVDKSNGLIYFDKRLMVPQPSTIQRPNCMIALNIDKERFLKAYTRDMLIMLNKL